ncbi:hypothetical protein AMTRI_Chr03g137890 [Amborella trichopoda]|uniref:2-oxoglutarate-dependent dioxygenase DAO n=1 Tax=Amborella trichopoda TaxID=13333 RepID=W1PTP6_AMBTC|nr:2-oxoglutarate-dependent dioxygenase DAO [Amborella trichopoda]ERN11428.1 hypothetical protein AMTR_s00022p00049050 [Amborella trichopoda]|eukprot:XP_006849847.1 2-oxoglutarate-dependent dioxygenase DAO [Amborella trichopoda]
MVKRIPVIDLKCFPQQSSALLKGCEEFGCFRLINHGMPSKSMSEMKSTVRCLLDQPLEIKKQNIDAINGSGYMAPNAINPLYEALGLYDAPSPQAIQAFCDQLQASDPQRDTIQSYSHKIYEVAMDVASKMAESLGLEADLFNGWACQFRINKYLFSEEKLGETGVCIHTDSGFLTVLQDDERVSGLEVMSKNGEFVEVEPLPGSLIVILGDMAQVWSNGRFLNVKHKVMCKEATVRVSIAFFLLGPKGGTTMEVHTKLIDREHPRLYRPMSYEEYRNMRLSTGDRDGDALALYLCT